MLSTKNSWYSTINIFSINQFFFPRKFLFDGRKPREREGTQRERRARKAGARRYEKVEGNIAYGSVPLFSLKTAAGVTDRGIEANRILHPRTYSSKHAAIYFSWQTAYSSIYTKIEKIADSGIY